MSGAAFAPGICPVPLSSFPTENCDRQCTFKRFEKRFILDCTATSLRRACSGGHWLNYAHRPNGSEVEGISEEQDYSGRRTVGVFWDLDNKPPVLVPPYDAAMRLRRLASEFGEVVDMVAYANKNAFTYVPPWVKEQRQERRLLDQLEVRGLVKVERPYFCKLCGRMCKTNVALRRHFKQMHERERERKLAYLKTLRGKRRAKFLSELAEQEIKYKAAARRVLVPKSGYGLGSELRRAGVDVRTVESKPQAADEALKKHIANCMNEGVECMCLLSDDSDFLGILKTAKSKGLKVVVVGDTFTLEKVADFSFSWQDVASGRLFCEASLQRWVNDDAYQDDEGDHNEYGHGSFARSFETREDAETDDDSDNEEGPYVSEIDDDEEYEQYLANLRWTLQ
ncbi:hypothetical protein Mapa_005286 [Marchantia paleacea]|nr:hypothetical protein Mapa_005286 [Marchantia paleacea]